MITGDIKEIPLHGLSARGNGYECADGELQVCHNMLHDGYGLKPVVKARVTDKLGIGWSGMVFVHHTSTGKVELFVDDNGCLFHGKEKLPFDKLPGGIFIDRGYGITSVGNVLVINITKNNGVAAGHGVLGLHYFRFENGDYSYLGQRLPDLNLQFSMVHHSGKESGGGIAYDDSYIIGVHHPQDVTHFRAPLNFDGIMSYADAFEKYPQWVDQMLAAVNSIKAKARKHGLFTGRFFLRVAYRLYDGSYASHSVPVLMKPSDEMNPMIFPYYFSFSIKDDGVRHWDIDLKFKTLTKFYSLVVKSLLTNEAKDKLRQWRDIIDRVCVFVTPEIQDYSARPERMFLKRKEKLFSRFGIDGTPLDDSYVSIINGTQRPDGGTDDEVVSTLTAKDVLGEGMKGYGEPWKDGIYIPYANGGRCEHKRRLPPPAFYQENTDRYSILANDNADSDTENRYVLRDVNRKAGLYKAARFVINNAQHTNFDHLGDQEPEVFLQLFKEFGCHYHIVEFEKDGRTEEELLEQNYLFYPIKEYTLDEVLAIGEENSDVEMNYPEMEMNLAQDAWPGWNDTVKAPLGTSFVKIRENKLDNLQGEEGTLPDAYASLQNVRPDMLHVYNGRLNVAGLDISFENFPDTWLQSPVSDDNTAANRKIAHARAVIETDGQTVAAVANIDGGSCVLSDLWSGWLYFPHPDAKYFDIVYQEGNVFQTARIPLKSHPFMQGAYVFLRNTDISDFSQGLFPSAEEAVAALPKVADNLSYPNRLMTSDVDNPFVFPAQGVNAVGAGRIVAIKSATKAMSEGSAFGSLPLYVFSTDGVYPMSVGNDGLFSATNPPTRETLLNDSIDGALQIDNAILFLTERGLMRLVGQHTELLSAQLSASTVDCPADGLPHWRRINDSFVKKGGGGVLLNAADFMAFIRKGARLAFDYVNYRVFVYRPFAPDDKSTHVAYVYDMGSKSWATIDNRLISSVEGYPGTIVNMADDGGATSSGVFDDKGGDFIGNGMALYISRPIKLGKADILKTVRTLIARMVSHGDVAHLALWGSRDMDGWRLVATGEDRITNITGTPYKYFIVAGWMGFKKLGDGISRLTFEEKDKLIDKIR